MATRLVPPPGLCFHPPGSGYVFSDGYEWRADSSGRWWLPSTHGHQLSNLLAQGWVIFREPPPKLIFKNEFERAAVEKPLAISAILDLCAAEQVRIRVEGDVLKIKPINNYVTPGLRAHLELRRIEIRNELSRRDLIQWEDV